MVVGLFKGLAALVVVDHAFNPFLGLEVVAQPHAEGAVLTAVPWGEFNLQGDAPADGVEVVGWSVVHLAFMVIDPLRVAQGVDERAAVPIREHDLPREGGAVGALDETVQDLLNIIGAREVIVIDEGDILARGLRQQHVPLLTDAYLSIVGAMDHLDIALADLTVEFITERLERVLPFDQGGNQYRQLVAGGPRHLQSPQALD